MEGQEGQFSTNNRKQHALIYREQTGILCDVFATRILFLSLSVTGPERTIIPHCIADKKYIITSSECRTLQLRQFDTSVTDKLYIASPKFGDFGCRYVFVEQILNKVRTQNKISINAWFPFLQNSILSRNAIKRSVIALQECVNL